MSAHFVSLKGDRSSNEDSHNIILGLNGINSPVPIPNLTQTETKINDKNSSITKVNYYGVYDGHGGKFVSNFLSQNLPHLFIANKVTYPLDPEYVNKVYDKVQSILFTKYENEATECGSTCLVVCHFKENQKDFLNIMNTGDSRCVMCKNNIAVPLTRDHKPNWPDEFARI